MNRLSRAHATPLEAASLMADLILDSPRLELGAGAHQETPLATRYDDKHISTIHTLSRNSKEFEDPGYMLYTPSSIVESVGRAVVWERSSEKPAIFSVVGDETFPHEAPKGADKRVLGILLSSVAYNPEQQAIVTGFNGKDKIITPGIVRKALRKLGYSSDSEAPHR